MDYKLQQQGGYSRRIAAVFVAILLTGIVGYIGMRDGAVSSAAVPFQTALNAAPVVHVSHNGDSTAVDGPVAFALVADRSTTYANAPDSITKVEYWVDGKLVSTQTDPPYTYTLDTKKLRNGSYELVSKTYYADGTSSSSKQKIQVNNAVDFAYIMAHYGIGIIGSLAGLAIIVFLVWLYVWPHFNRKPTAAYIYDIDGDVMRSAIGPVPSQYEAPNPSVVTPSNVTAESTVLDPTQTAAAATTEPIAMDNPQTVSSVTQPPTSPAPAATAPVSSVQAQAPSSQTTIAPPPSGAE